MIFPKEANELLHIIREHRKGIPISKVFEAEAKAYKYGKEIYCNVIKKQIEDTFENTDSFAYQELSKMKEYQDKLVIDYEDKGIGITFGSYPGISFIDEYIGRWSTPDTKEEFKVLNELLEYVSLPPQPINSETGTKKYTAKYYVLAYLFECHAKGESIPTGKKKKLESLGNERIGAGKGNRFYKVFNEIAHKDLNSENDLIEIGGEDWRQIVLELSEVPELVEEYLQKKQL